MSASQEETSGGPHPHGTGNNAEGPQPPSPENLLSSASEQATPGLLFSTRRPKNAVAGLSSGMKNLGRGMVAGTGAMVALPVMGWKTEGAKGAAKGVGLGMAAFLGCTIAGAVTGVSQVGRGIYNTAECISEMREGIRVWDENRRAWRLIDLGKESFELPPSDDDIFVDARMAQLQRETGKEAEKDEQPSNDDLYTLLGVERTATPSEIKKAFAKQALRFHPDKNPGDATAATRFQKIHDAYQVLSNPATRLEYDRTGKTAGSDGSNRTSTPGARGPFEDVLGGAVFEPFVGRLKVFMYLNAELHFTKELMEKFIDRRAMRCAVQLARFLDRDIDFGQLEREEIEDMVRCSQGPQLLNVIGDEYAFAGKQHLDSNVVSSAADKYIHEGQQVATGISAATKNVAKVAMAMYNNSASPEDISPIFFTLARTDMISVVSLACKMVLHDTSASSEVIDRRAQQMKQLGELMLKKAAEAAPVASIAPPPATAEAATPPTEGEQAQPASQEAKE